MRVRQPEIPINSTRLGDAEWLNPRQSLEQVLARF